MSQEEKSVCVYDFGGSYRMEIGGITIRIYPFNCYADWDGKMTAFGGAWRDVPDMPSETEPTEDQIESWVEKHWNEKEWYEKYQKELKEKES